MPVCLRLSQGVRTPAAIREDNTAGTWQADQEGDESSSSSDAGEFQVSFSFAYQEVACCWGGRGGEDGCTYGTRENTQQSSASQVTCCMFLQSMSVCMHRRSQLLFRMVNLLVNKWHRQVSMHAVYHQ